MAVIYSYLSPSNGWNQELMVTILQALEAIEAKYAAGMTVSKSCMLMG